MFTEMHAHFLIPVHWDTFRLGKEPLGEAIRRLDTAAGQNSSQIVIHRVGETWTLPCCTHG